MKYKTIDETPKYTEHHIKLVNRTSLAIGAAFGLLVGAFVAQSSRIYWENGFERNEPEPIVVSDYNNLRHGAPTLEDIQIKVNLTVKLNLVVLEVY